MDLRPIQLFSRTDLFQSVDGLDWLVCEVQFQLSEKSTTILPHTPIDIFWPML